ncbi:MAG: hypothetical protein Q9196_006479, partial [Gyalolechia fulgens]
GDEGQDPGSLLSLPPPPPSLMRNILRRRRRGRKIEKKAREQGDYMKVAGLHPQEKEAREAREKAASARAREVEARQRVSRRKTRKKEEWEAEVAQFGDEEAHHRRAEYNTRVEDQNNDFSTSEVENKIIRA